MECSFLNLSDLSSLLFQRLRLQAHLSIPISTSIYNPFRNTFIFISSSCHTFHFWVERVQSNVLKKKIFTFAFEILPPLCKKNACSRKQVFCRLVRAVHPLTAAEWVRERGWYIPSGRKLSDWWVLRGRRLSWTWFRHAGWLPHLSLFLIDREWGREGEKECSVGLTPLATNRYMATGHTTPLTPRETWYIVCTVCYVKWYSVIWWGIFLSWFAFVIVLRGWYSPSRLNTTPYFTSGMVYCRRVLISVTPTLVVQIWSARVCMLGYTWNYTEPIPFGQTPYKIIFYSYL